MKGQHFTYNRGAGTIRAKVKRVMPKNPKIEGDDKP